MNCTSATAWRQDGPTAKLTRNQAIWNINAVIIPTSCMTPLRPKAGLDKRIITLQPVLFMPDKNDSSLYGAFYLQVHHE
jgi:hypothetical protein